MFTFVNLDFFIADEAKRIIDIFYLKKWDLKEASIPGKKYNELVLRINQSAFLNDYWLQ